MLLELRFPFIFKDSRTRGTLLTKHPSRPSEYWFCSARLPGHVLCVFLCSSDILRFICLPRIAPKYYFLFTKSFKDFRLQRHLSFPKHRLLWAQYCVHSAEVLLISPRWRHDGVMFRDLKTKSGLQLLEIIHGENVSALFLFLPGATECLLNHWQKI